MCSRTLPLTKEKRREGAATRRAQNNGQYVAGHDDRPNIFLAGQTRILAGQIMNTIIFFCLIWNIKLRWQ